MPTSPPARPWHVLPLDELLDTLDSGEHGLTHREAGARLERYGPNQLPHQPPPGWWQIVLRQFRNPLIYVLGLAALVSLSLGHLTDAFFIAGVLLLNSLIGGYQEWRAEQTAQALQRLLRIRAAVERSGEVTEIDAEQLVPGDIVWLESGNRVPADVRLLTSHGLEIDEALLTGESLAVPKDPAWIGEATTPLADRVNMAHAGSIVGRGRSKGVVVSTGTGTAVGQLALDVLSSRGGRPPLLVRMEKFSRVIAASMLVAAIVVGLLGVILQGYSWTEMFLFAVALAVAAIPEGLPIALTVALAIATTRMSRRGLIVRRLTAVEGLGSCTLVATDKTGTITCNELTARLIRLPDGQELEVSGEGYAPLGQVLREGKPMTAADDDNLAQLARAAVLCNESDLLHRNGGWTWRGDAVDVAFLSLGHKLGYSREATLDQYPLVNHIPFEPERQFAASYHAVNGRAGVVFVKGAPERVLEMCGAPADVVATQMKAAEEMARSGFRVLALAHGTTSRPMTATESPATPSQLKLIGLVGMIDPLRPGMRQAVEDCHAAGVRVVMITGDHRITALAISRELGLASDVEDVVTGAELLNSTPQQLRDMVQRATVFARVAPQQKLQLVEAAQSNGQFVAVTGDGVNDAPALRAANIGVAMGKAGTDVAREAAELVLSDDNFATIVAGIEEGRIAYDNVRKVIYLLITTGAAEIVLVALAAITGMPLPLLPVQLLWLNLVTNGIQDVALAFEPGEDGVLRRKPRPPNERIFNQLMIERTVVGAIVIGTVGFVAFYWMLRTGMPEHSARNALLLLMVLFENVHIGNCRSETRSALVLSPLRSPILLAGTLLALLLHVVMLYLPIGQTVLRTEPLNLTSWITLVGLSLSVFVAIELHKLTWRWRKHRRAAAA